jgi:hypothetical protein
MRMRVCLVVLVVLAAALLTGCGSSSKTSSSNTNASAATATTGTTTTSAKAAKGPNAIRVTALRACLLKNGIPLPKRIPGQKGAPGAGGFLGGAALPKGVTRDQYQAALKKCGAGTFASPGRRVSSPAFKAALTKFATCLRQNGVNISAPNTSGTGPIFSTKGINTASAQFRTAERKCSAILRAGLKASAGARSATGGAPGTAGATGSAGQTKASPAPKLKVKVPPKVAHALQQFTACMREHGVTSYPEPEGASFNLSHTHVDTKSAQYKAAEKKCNPILNAAF